MKQYVIAARIVSKRSAFAFVVCPPDEENTFTVLGEKLAAYRFFDIDVACGVSRELNDRTNLFNVLFCVVPLRANVCQGDMRVTEDRDIASDLLEDR